MEGRVEKVKYVALRYLRRRRIRASPPSPIRAVVEGSGTTTTETGENPEQTPMRQNCHSQLLSWRPPQRRSCRRKIAPLPRSCSSQLELSRASCKLTSPETVALAPMVMLTGVLPLEVKDVPLGLVIRLVAVVVSHTRKPGPSVIPVSEPVRRLKKLWYCS